MLALFIGPDDADTCDGCDDAVNGNPYTEDSVPEPGEFQCMGNCRHMVQLGEDAPDNIAPYSWSMQVSFNTADSPYYTDETPDSELPTDEDTSDTKEKPDVDDLPLGLYTPKGKPIYTGPDEDNLPETPEEYATYLFNNGLTPDDMPFPEEFAALVSTAFDDVSAEELDLDYAHELLTAGDVELLNQLVQDSDDALEMLTQMGKDGFDDKDALEVYTLGTVLGKTAKLADDGRWYV